MVFSMKKQSGILPIFKVTLCVAVLFTCSAWSFVLREKPGSCAYTKALNQRDEGNYSEAIKQLELALSQAENDTLRGDVMTDLGILYLRQRGEVMDKYQVARNKAKGIALLEKARLLENRKAILILGDIYLKGESVPVDIAKAKALLEIVRNTSGAAAMLLAGIEQDTEKAEELRQQAIALFQRDARDGDVGSMMELGDLYQKNGIVQKNDVEAENWYRRAIAGGNADASMRLAMLWQASGGHSKEDIFSLKRDAAEHDVPDAMLDVAFAYVNGDGTEKNLHEADAWITEMLRVRPDRAAAMAHRFAEIQEEGDEYTKIKLKWNTLAAEQGVPEAMVWLAEAYNMGYAVPQDVQVANGWYVKAAEAGNGKAQYQLGMAYARGTGVEKDREKARTWLLKAKDNGYPLAMQLLDAPQPEVPVPATHNAVPVQ